MRCFSVIGPSQTGKSTLVAKLASIEGQAKGSSSQDALALTEFEFLDEPWCALDTPGAIEFVALAQDALVASDACILCVSPVPEEAVLAAPYLKAIEASGTPCILFVNRMDEPRGRLRDVVAALQDYSNHPLILRQIPIREGDTIVGSCDLISERAWRYRDNQPSALIEIPGEMIDREHEARTELLEHLSEYDDWLLEELIEDRQPACDALYSLSTRVLKENRVIPVLFGSASHSNGMTRLMKLLRHEAPKAEGLRQRLAEEAGIDAATLSAVSVSANHRPAVGKTVLIRALKDGLKQGVQLAGSGLGAVQDPGTGRLIANGGPAVGFVFAAVKSDHVPAPALLTADAALPAPDWATPPTPMVARILVPASERDETKLSGALAKLAETDHGMEVTREEETGAKLVCVQGPVHLREISKTLSEVFHVEVTDRTPTAAYRETISKPAEIHYRHKKQTGGAGQFADVRLTVQPNARGEGFTFNEVVKGGAVPRNYIPAVEAGTRDAMDSGPLGFPVIDVSVTLTDGQYHAVDSNDFAFRTAGKMGMKQALAEAAPVLMQPIFRVDIHLPSVHSGNLIPIISSIKGQVLGFDRDEGAKGWDIFRALVPGGGLDELAHQIRSVTQGIGYFARTFDHFEEMYGKEAEAIVAGHAQGA
ncbi:elongation factor G [Consotaella aegiceratis]|uniref:elongation factor G n=1 Tax=Consotaella aegiceratis TaxID=3097961 RepID=UPI002F421973